MNKQIPPERLWGYAQIPGVKMNDNHDERGRFASGNAVSQARSAARASGSQESKNALAASEHANNLSKAAEGKKDPVAHRLAAVAHTRAMNKHLAAANSSTNHLAKAQHESAAMAHEAAASVHNRRS